MISLKKYLDSNAAAPVAGSAAAGDPVAAALEAYGATLRAIGDGSLDACPGLGGGLKRELSELEAELLPGMGCANLLAHGRRAGDRVRGWGHEVARHYQDKAREVKEILLTVARTAESVSTHDANSAERLSAVTERLKAIATLDDLSEIRASIDKSAAELRASIDRMAAEGKEVLHGLESKLNEYQAKLEEAELLASRDVLTGVRNRVFLEAQMQKRIEAGAGFCAAIVDIDRFKEINDRHGHLTGDALLRQFAGELSSACRSTDVVGRWGGDEFLLLFDAGLEEARVQVERLRNWACGLYSLSTQRGMLKVHVDASIGLAARTGAETMNELLARADAAMYAEKAAARARHG